MNDEPVRIGGVVPLTTVDFPGRLACVIFCQGCPWRCRYCHNPHLQSFRPWKEAKTPSWEEMLVFLEKRQGLLDGVVFSGGEPTFQKDLRRAMTDVRKMGFDVGMHTAAPDFDRFSRVVDLVDWVGIDVKAPFSPKYHEVVGTIVDPDNVRKSLEFLIANGISYQVRTTCHPLLLSGQDLADLQGQLQKMGARPSIIQEFRREGCLDPELLI
jgi:pyruvate formate lyase activating enzyme